MPKDTSQTIQDSRRAAMSILQGAKDKAQARNNRNSYATTGRGGTQASRAVDNFLRAGRIHEARMPRGSGNPSAFDTAAKVRSMSDSEFEEALKSGSITPEQLRKAGEYDWDTYMGDVWSEGDIAEQIPEPTYDEFMADPEKYGYRRGLNEETDRSFDRYRRTVKKQ